MMTTVWRVAHGLPIYVRPSLAWAPFLYSPLFFYCAAGVSRLTGIGYAALRLVSIAATLGSCGTLIAIVYRETRNWTAAIASAGLFAMLYGLVLSWYDIGRVDSLALFFFLLAIYCMRFQSPIVAAVVWTLAFQTKQSFLPLALLAFAAHWQQPRRLLLGLGSFVLFAGISIAAFNHFSHGWYRYYVFGTVAELGISLYTAKLYIPFDLLKPLPMAAGVILFAAVVQPFSWRSRRVMFYAVLSVLVLGGIWFARAHEGSYLNTLIPAYAWICLLFGLALGRLTAAEAADVPRAGEARLPTSDSLRPASIALLWLAACAQILMHLYRPGQFAVSPETVQVRWAFIDRLRATPGDVWLVNHSYDALLAGKPLHAEMDAFDAVLGRPDAASVAEVQADFRDHHFTTVILDRAPSTYKPNWLFSGPEFRASYPLGALAPGASMPGTGDQPVYMFLSCQPPPAAASALALDTTLVKQGDCPR